MRKIKTLIIIMFIGVTSLLSQDKISTVLFPVGLNFVPLKANMCEPKMGIWYHNASTNLKVDIGNSVDLFGYRIGSDVYITAGADFWGYALTTSYSGNRLQIDALDGFFGGNISYSQKFENRKVLIRFRIIHNSAHLVDGHYDKNKGGWLKQEPIPYTEDFGEITIAQESYFENFVVKYYGSIAYSTMVRPLGLKKWAYNAGFELAANNYFKNLFGSDSSPFIAYHFELDGIPEYIGNNNIMLGIKFGNWYEKGLSLYISYYSGSNYFSEYYFQRISKFGIGMSVDFF
ncbi:MAG: hypothetical protein JEY94_00755 [Melioribacteraceae bacterium]|nr:hypothetical protein [Melioribacteraceae bacterium]